MSDKDTTIQVIQFPIVNDPRGNLTFIQHPDQIPFNIERVFWTYDVPGGEARGGHAYHLQEEIIIALSGSLDVVVTNPDGSRQTHPLNRSYYGLYLPPRTWRHMENFSSNSFSLHLSSRFFDEMDYIRDFGQYVRLFNTNT